MTRPISDLDVPAASVEAALRKRIAHQYIEERLGRAAWLVKHPEWPTGVATEGERAEYRHLLDVDAPFARLAADHPDRCSRVDDYPGWTPGGHA